VSPSVERREPVLDLRTYKLVPGGGKKFERIARERVLPMLERFGIEVVGFGPSLDDGDLYYLIRSFSSAARRDEQLEAFYGSDEWRRNHREAVLALIESYHVLLVPLALGAALSERCT
jgi:NIPSNAP